jgi:hypothetical protein
MDLHIKTNGSSFVGADLFQAGELYFLPATRKSHEVFTQQGLFPARGVCDARLHGATVGIAACKSEPIREV